MTVGWRRPFPPLHHYSHPYTVIPAKAGIHTPAYTKSGDTGVLDSGLRRNDGGVAAAYFKTIDAAGPPPFEIGNS